MRIEQPDLVKSVRDFGQAAGLAWKDVTMEEREPYQEKHLVLKANYNTAMEDYRVIFLRFHISGKNLLIKVKKGHFRPFESIFASKQEILGQFCHFPPFSRHIHKTNLYVPPKGYSKSGSMSTKKQRDPNAPKKPSTAFFLFMGDGNRIRLKQENPEITPSEVGKVLGAEWRELDAKIKSGYEKTYETNLIQWRKDKAAYEKSETQKKEKVQKRKKSETESEESEDSE